MAKEQKTAPAEADLALSASDEVKLADVVPAETPGLKELVAKGIDTPAKVIKAYNDMGGEIRKRVTVPAEDASDDDWKAALKKLGASENAADYAVDDTAPDSLKSLAAHAVTAGLTKKQWQMLTKSVVEGQKTQADEVQADVTAALEKKYGEEKLALAERRLAAMKEEKPALAALLGSPDVAVRTAMYDLAIMLEEKTAPAALPASEPVQRGDGGGASPQAARDRWNALTKTPAYSDPAHPGHSRAMAEEGRLMKIVAESGYGSMGHVPVSEK